MSVIGPFMAPTPSLGASEICFPSPSRVGSPSPRCPDQYTPFRIPSPVSTTPDRSVPFRIPSPTSKSKSPERYVRSPIASPKPKNPKRPSTASSAMSSTSSSSSSSSSSTCSNMSQSSDATKAWMKAARKHWNQAILHLDRLLSNWLLIDEETIIILRKTFVMLDFHMKSIIGSTSEPLAKRYCYEAEKLRHSVETYAKTTPEPSTLKADILIVAALKHLFVNRNTSNEAVRLGVRFAAHIVHSSTSEAELLAWARFFYNNAVYDETAAQLEAAIAELHETNCMEGAGASAQDRRRNILHSVAEQQQLKSCFED